MALLPFSGPPSRWKAGTVASSITPSGGTGILVGIGTTSPTAKLHIAGNTPSIRIGAGSSAGFNSSTFIESSIPSGGTPDYEYVIRHFNENIASNTSLFRGLYLGLGRGGNISDSYIELGGIGESGTDIPLLEVQRTGAATALIRWQQAFQLANNKSIAMQRTDSGVVTAINFNTSNELVIGTAYTNATSMPIIYRLDSSTGNHIWRATNTELMRLKGTGELGIGTNSPDRRLHSELDDASTNTVLFPLRITRTSSGTPANGIGVGLEFEVETSASNNEVGATLEAVTSDVTSTSEDFDLVVKTMAAGAAAAERIRITSDGRLYGTALHNNSGAVTGTTNQYVASGTYTPTLTNVANLDASTAYECQWIRVGNVVSVSGKVDVDPALAATSTQLGISLPIASNIGTNEDCSGSAFASGIAGQGAAILGDATNDRAQLQYISGDVTNQSMYFTFQYTVI